LPRIEDEIWQREGERSKVGQRNTGGVMGICTEMRAGRRSDWNTTLGGSESHPNVGGEEWGEVLERRAQD
jgi:hypothetical protein